MQSFTSPSSHSLTLLTLTSSQKLFADSCCFSLMRVVGGGVLLQMCGQSAASSSGGVCGLACISATFGVTVEPRPYRLLQTLQQRINLLSWGGNQTRTKFGLARKCSILQDTPTELPGSPHRTLPLQNTCALPSLLSPVQRWGSLFAQIITLLFVFNFLMWCSFLCSFFY